MARKKKKSTAYQKHYFYHTRKGFYTLAFAALFLGIGAMNFIGDFQRQQDVLGKADENKGKSEERKEEESEERKQKAEREREERKQEIEEEYEIETDNLKLEIRSKGNELERKLKPGEIEDELDEDEIEDLKDEIEEEFEAETETEIEVASSEGEIILKKNKVKVRTGFPLSINPETNELTITKPDGTTKIVTILPDAAVANFLRHKKIEIILPDDPTGTDSADTDPIDTDDDSTESAETEDQDLVSLVEEDDIIAYQIKAREKFKLLGIFNVTGETTGYVSAETGEVIKEKRPFLTRLLDVLSP